MAQETADQSELRIQESVGSKIRELRKAKGLSLIQLSGHIGISQGHLSKIETGKAAISIKALSLICRFFRRPVDYLFQKEETTHIIGTLNLGEGPEKESVIRLAKDVRSATDGQLSLVRLEADQLGGGVNPVEHLKNGSIHLFMDDLALFRACVPDFDLFALPYIFPAMDHQLRFLASDFFRDNFTRPLTDQGVRFINPRWNWFRGVERVLVSRTPVFSPADIRGRRVRIYESEVLKLYWRLMGAEPVSVHWEDLNRAFDEGEIDVIPCHKSHVYPMGFSRQAKYVTRIGDMPDIVCVAMNEARYRMLCPGSQEALTACSDKTGDIFTGLAQEKNEPYESMNIRENSAAYIRVDHRPWQAPVKEALKRSVASGLLSGTVVSALEKNNRQQDSI
ncbi:MAG: TRAP transporter substrate-binding protein DctP [Desulfobacter sp.]|nr:MAG: TRAP transporter substrate-binding protein DctP [Desulfobacter sp.]